MAKKVLSVGQCVPDSCRLGSFLRENFAAEMVSVALPGEALETLQGQVFDLVLVNRKLDADYSDGLGVVRAIKADARFRDTPVMLVTNYDEHQRAAVAEGAVYGFGKLQYDQPETLERLRPLLG